MGELKSFFDNNNINVNIDGIDASTIVAVVSIIASCIIVPTIRYYIKKNKKQKKSTQYLKNIKNELFSLEERFNEIIGNDDNVIERMLESNFNKIDDGYFKTYDNNLELLDHDIKEKLRNKIKKTYMLAKRLNSLFINKDEIEALNTKTARETFTKNMFDLYNKFQKSKDILFK